MNLKLRSAPPEEPTCFEKRGCDFDPEEYDPYHRSDDLIPLADRWAVQLLARGGMWRQIPLRDLMLGGGPFTSGCLRDFLRFVNRVALFCGNREFLVSGDPRALRVGERDFAELKATLPAADFPEIGDPNLRLASLEQRVELLDRILGSLRPITLIAPAGVASDTTLETYLRITLRANLIFECWEDDGSAWLERILKRFRRLRGFEGRVLTRNLDELENRLSLSALEAAIAAFAALSRTHALLRAALRLLTRDHDKPARLAAIEALSCVLKATPEDLRSALSRDSRLYESGMLSLTSRDADEICGIFREPSFYGLPVNLADSGFSLSVLLYDFLERPEDHLLREKDFAHVPGVPELFDFMKKLKKAPRGAHIMICGEAGSGKSALLSALDRELRLEPHCFDITPLRGLDTGSCLQELRVLLCNPAIPGLHVRYAVVDHADNLLRHLAADAGSKPNGEHGYADLEFALRHCRHPVIWLVEDERLIPGSLRRECFDFTIHVKAPENPPRGKIVRRLFERCLNAEAQRWLIDDESIPPTRLNRLRPAVHRAADAQKERNGRRLTLEQLKEIIAWELWQPRDHDPCDAPALPGTDFSPCALAAELERVGNGLVGFLGGDPAHRLSCAEYLSRALGRPLLRASYTDLTDPREGDPRERIESLFRKARGDHAVIYVENADFLAEPDENASQRSADPAVTELFLNLTALSGGYLIASTDRAGMPDYARTGRFHFIGRFDRPLLSGDCLGDQGMTALEDFPEGSCFEISQIQ